MAEQKSPFTLSASREWTNENRLRMIRKGEGKNLRNFTQGKIKQLNKELSTNEHGPSSSNIRPPKLVTPPVEDESPVANRDMPTIVLQDKDVSPSFPFKTQLICFVANRLREILVSQVISPQFTKKFIFMLVHIFV